MRRQCSRRENHLQIFPQLNACLPIYNGITSRSELLDPIDSYIVSHFVANFYFELGMSNMRPAEMVHLARRLFLPNHKERLKALSPLHYH